MWIIFFIFGILAHNTTSADNPEYGDVRLVDGTSSNEGRVEIYYESGWGTVCDDNWGITDADVVCKQLGYPWALDAKVEAYFGQGTGEIYLDDVECYGNEDAIYDCGHSGVYNHDCRHTEDAGVVCETDDIEPEDGMLRLTGDDTDGASGLLGILYRGVWGSVCRDDFDMNDANVACKQLGFEWAIDFQAQYNIVSTCWSWITDIDCDGTESSLLDCGHEGLYEQQCDVYDTISISCSNGTYGSEYIPVRLRDGGDDSSGRVEVYDEGTWGTVCDKKWDINDADVVCRQLGFDSALEANRDGFYGGGSGPIHIKGVRCEGSENYLSACAFKYAADSQCSHMDDAGVVCRDDDDDDDGSSYSYYFAEYSSFKYSVDYIDYSFDQLSEWSESSQVVTACDRNPCVNGVCLSTASSTSQYVCTCNTGWTGTECDIEITACDSNPCVNGNCYLEPTSDDYHCTCYDDWTGVDCDEVVVGCGLEPCLNGGLCESLSDDGDYKCDCLYAWIGTHCETERNGCNLHPCLNNGDCIDMDAGGYTCTCMSGYSGDNCEIVETACDSNPCQNGDCLIVPMDNSYFCNCNEGWTGQLCEEEVNMELECSSNPCLHGQCFELSNDGYFCSCDDNWAGVNCETSTIGCVAAPCLNGGTCMDIGADGEYACECPAGFEGQDCQTVESLCETDPCINGECLDIQSSGTFYCLCDESWTGVLCDTEIACENNPCENAVTCIDLSTGEYTCICQTGWIGDNCDEFVSVNTNSMETTIISDESTTMSVVASPETQTSSDLPIGILAGVGGAALVIVIASIALGCFLRNRHSSPKPTLSGVENKVYELDDPVPPASVHHYDNTKAKIIPRPISSQSKFSNDSYEKPFDDNTKPNENVYQELSGNDYEEIRDSYMGLSQPNPMYMDILPNKM